MNNFSPWHAVEKKVNKIQELFGYRYNNNMNWHKQSR